MRLQLSVRSRSSLQLFSFAAAVHLFISGQAGGLFAPRVVAAVAQAGPGTSQVPAAQRINAQRLLSDVRALSAPEMEGRRSGTDGNRRAQSLILGRFKELKLHPVNGSYEQRFPLDSHGTTGADRLPGTSLLAVLPGSSRRDEFVVVSAHYDHLGIRNGQIYGGADDNASGVAAMLAIAGWCAAMGPAKSLLFVAFDAEEHGLRGSKYFVANPPIELKRISAVVNLDMVGRGDANILHVVGTFHYPALKAPVVAAAKGRNIMVRFGHDRPGVRGEVDWTSSSDHGSFHAAGIPFLYFGVDDHGDYHKPTDTADRIPRAFFIEATELVLDTVQKLTEMREN